MTRSFIFLTVLVSMSAVERYVISEPAAQVTTQQQTPRQRDGGLKVPLVKSPPRPR